MKTEIKAEDSGEGFTLFVNGYRALSRESFGVCAAVEFSILNNKKKNFYSEGAEVADIIRQHFEKVKTAS